MELDSSSITAATAQFRIIDLDTDEYNNESSSANGNYLVRINEGLHYANTAGI
jgi:hypothetical protein